MTLNFLAALILFCVVSSVTPGPNNLMVMASGANFGYRRTLPHMLGIAFGFAAMVLLVGIGLMQLFETLPMLRQILTVASVAYLLYLAWKIANAAPPGNETDPTRRPMSFLQAVAFQWVNPKAWTMSLTAITIYAPGRSLPAVALIALVFGLVCLPSLSIWVVLGQQVRRLLRNPTRLRAFNWSMAALLVASLYPVFLH
ncbi:LysE family translocator [Pseudooceanicola sediminis]|uniref:LysE family translocator n=1 Tax=Pseudooceanicola sediminis TaxID=2211117 RepID=A0A399IZK7_9RHOB|nr:LysE family translocator [Pseudooceanicola sediminis]KAA2313014.1 LysE family translocator [Puniceibacterium sp. HSS470]RII37719.1 LysE family translocator [Pseudooceanicola sediminis]